MALWTRVKAAEENASVSHLVGDLLRRMMQQHQQFERARREFQRFQTAVISDGAYPSREGSVSASRCR